MNLNNSKPLHIYSQNECNESMQLVAEVCEFEADMLLTLEG